MSYGAFNDAIPVFNAANPISFETSLKKNFLSKSLAISGSNIKEVFPDVEIVAFDSRFFKKGQAKLGNFLCKGVKDLEEGRTIQKYFESVTYTNILITRWEDLDEESKKNFT